MTKDMKYKMVALPLLCAALLLSGCSAPSEKEASEANQAASSKMQGSDAEASGGENGTESGKTLTAEDLAKVPVLGQGRNVKGADGKTYYTNSVEFYDTFDTVVQFTAYTKDEAEFQKWYELLHEEFQRLHRLYDNFHTYEGIVSLLSVNQDAAKHPVKLDPDLFDLLKFSVDNYEKTLKKVNIAMGAPLMLWTNAREAAAEAKEAEEHAEAASGSGSGSAPLEEKETPPEGKLPDAAALQEAGKHMHLSDVMLNEKDHTVQFQDAQLKLDAGAVAKGFATELVAKKLEAAGLEHGLIAAGGNVRLIGTPVDGDPTWTVGITHPRPEQGTMIAKVEAPGEMSMVTSGDYQRYFMVDGVRYHHIIDPSTLQPGRLWSSVTVRTPDSGLADLLSTAFFLSTKEEAQKIIAQFPGTPIDVLWVDTDMNVSMTEGMKAEIIK